MLFLDSACVVYRTASARTRLRCDAFVFQGSFVWRLFTCASNLKEWRSVVWWLVAGVAGVRLVGRAFGSPKPYGSGLEFGVLCRLYFLVYVLRKTG